MFTNFNKSKFFVRTNDIFNLAFSIIFFWPVSCSTQHFEASNGLSQSPLCVVLYIYRWAENTWLLYKCSFCSALVQHKKGCKLKKYVSVYIFVGFKILHIIMSLFLQTPSLQHFGSSTILIDVWDNTYIHSVN